jgi:uncharacterized repeat protein (TIGR01451 family)
MLRLFKTASALLVVPVVALSSSAVLAAAAGQIEGGDIYRVRNVTENGSFADPVNADKCETVQFKVRIHNPGPDPLTGVTVKATLPSTASTSISSLVTVSAVNANPTSRTDTAGVKLPAAYTIGYKAGSTQLLDPNNAVLQNLPDGIVGSGVNVPNGVGVSLGQIRFVQFQANIGCPTPPPQVSFACKGADVKQIDRTHFDFTAYAEVQNATVNSYVFTVRDANGKVVDTKTVNTSALSAIYHFNQSTVGTYTITAVIHTNKGTTEVGKCEAGVTVTSTPPVTPPQVLSTTTLPNTGPGDVVALFAGVSALGAAGHYVVSRRRQS